MPNMPHEVGEAENREPMNILHPKWFGSLEQMLDDMPQNRCLWRDGGLWHIRDEENEVDLYVQDCNEDFSDFIERAYNAENIYHDWQ